MADVTIQARDNGPLLVKGQVDLLDGEGNLIETTNQVYLCRCGLSSNFPYCNGAHKGKLQSEVRVEKK